MPEHDCKQEGAIGELKADQRNLGRSLDDLRDGLKENSACVKALNSTLDRTVEIVKGLSAGQLRTTSWADKISGEAFRLIAAILAALVVLHYK